MDLWDNQASLLCGNLLSPYFRVQIDVLALVPGPGKQAMQHLNVNVKVLSLKHPVCTIRNCSQEARGSCCPLFFLQAPRNIPFPPSGSRGSMFKLFIVKLLLKNWLWKFQTRNRSPDIIMKPSLPSKIFSRRSMMTSFLTSQFVPLDFIVEVGKGKCWFMSKTWNLEKWLSH